MIRTVYDKRVADTAVAHLYEHIVCDHITQALRSRGLFSYVDYTLIARTYSSGTVTVEFTQYQPSIAKIINTLVNDRIIFNADIINAALLQIMAELNSDITALDEEAVMRELELCNEMEWRVRTSRDDIAYSNSTEPNLIQYTPVSESLFGIIEQKIILAKNAIDEDLYPLFLVVAKALRSNLQEDIASHSFCFTYEDEFVVDNLSLCDTNRYRIDKRQADGITDEIETANNLLKRVQAGRFAERLSASLGQVLDGDSDTSILPAEDEILFKLGILVSKVTWQNTASVENINTILDSIKVEFSYIA